MRCNMLLPLFSKSTYIRQAKNKKQIKTSSSISAPAAAEELRVTEFTIQRREETRQEVYTAAAASLTHALQAVHVHSSWPGLRVFAQL